MTEVTRLQRYHLQRYRFDVQNNRWQWETNVEFGTILLISEQASILNRILREVDYRVVPKEEGQ